MSWLSRWRAAVADPVYRSRFGGLWIDRVDGDAVLERRIAAGEIGPELAERLRTFLRDGSVVIEGAVPADVVDRVVEDAERAWHGAFPEIRVEAQIDGVAFIAPTPELKAARWSTKLLDLYRFSEATREALFAPAIVEFLRAVFECAPLAFQSLSFRWGTQQPVHQDSAFVVLDRPLEMVASWIALEDVKPGTGELEYYAGSHRMPDHPLPGGKKHITVDAAELARGMVNVKSYPDELSARADALGLERRRFLPRKGDALLWAADLIHGGSKRDSDALTRQSLVTHYCPEPRWPDYATRGNHSGKIPWRGCHYMWPHRA